MPRPMSDGTQTTSQDDAYADVMTAVRAAAERGLQGQPFGNPYHDLWAGYPRPEKSVWGVYEALKRRDHAVKVFAWAIPDTAAIDAICAVSPRGVVEIGAGTGYWARLLSEANVPGGVTAFDLHLGGAPEMTWWPIYVGGPERAADYPDRTLLLCWPPYQDPMAADSLAAFHDAGGETVVYIGEGEGGCTGDDRFHQLLHRDNPDRLFTLDRTLTLPTWEAVHDALHIYYRHRPAQLAGRPALPSLVGDPTP